MHHSGTADLTTERLSLRRLLPEDAPAMFRNWASDPAVTKYLRWEPHTSPAETRELLAAWELLYETPDYYQWAICEKATGEVFGTISLYDSCLSEKAPLSLWRHPGLSFADGIWEPGYCIGRAWWNKGFTTEALRAVVDYWFATTDSGWLACSHAVLNPASGRVMEKAGFVYDHNAPYHKFDGTPVECKNYVLTRAAYEKGTLL